MTTFKAFLPAALMSVALIGCGGDDSSSDKPASIERLSFSGNTSAAQITAANRDAFVTTGGEVISTRALQPDPDELQLPYGVALDNSAVDRGLVQRVLQNVAGQITNELESLPVAAQSSGRVEGDCGGYASFEGSETSARVVFSSYCEVDEEDGNVVLNGTMTVTSQSSAELTSSKIEFHALSMTAGGNTVSMTGVMETKSFSNGASEFYLSAKMTANGNTSTVAGGFQCDSDNNCTFNDYVKSKAGVVRLDNLTLSKGADELVTVSARFYHPDHGYVELTGTNLELCPGSIASGSLTLDDGEQIITATFSSCGQYSLNSQPKQQLR